MHTVNILEKKSLMSIITYNTTTEHCKGIFKEGTSSNPYRFFTHQVPWNRLVHYSLTRWKIICSFTILKRQHYNCYLQHLSASYHFAVNSFIACFTDVVQHSFTYLNPTRFITVICLLSVCLSCSQRSQTKHLRVTLITDIVHALQKLTQFGIKLFIDYFPST